MGDDIVPILVGVAAGVAIGATGGAALVAIGATASIAGFTLGGGGLIAAAAIGGGLIGGGLGFASGRVADVFLSGDIASPEFSPSGLGGSVGQRGDVPGNKSFDLTGDGGFRRTSTGPQSPRPIIIGTYMVAGTVLDIFLLGENNKRQFAVVGIAKSPVTNVRVLVDNIDITTLPNFIDVTAGGIPEDGKPWLKYIGNGGSSGDLVLSNSGKKTFGLNAGAGDVVVSPEIYFFNVVPGKNEVRVFLSVDVPGVYVETLETANADYTNISTKTLIITYVTTGAVVDSSDTVTFTDAMKTSSPDYTGLNGLTMIFKVDGVDRTATFTASEIDAVTVAAKIDADIGAFVTTAVLGNDIIVYNDTHTAAGTLIDSGTGTAAAKLNFLAFNDQLSCANNINNQVTSSRVTATVINTDELRFESANADNKRLKFSGTGFTQLNLAQQNYGTVISYTLSKQRRDSSTITTIFSESDRSIERLVNAQAQKTQVLLDDSGDFYFESSLDSSGFWSFVLEVSKATNGASVNVAIVEVMSDFFETDDGDFTGIATQTLIIETNDGTQQTVTFGSSTNTAALAIIDINNQLGTLLLASASGDEILIEALSSPVGTDTTAEIKQLKVVGGTAATAMNFKSIFSETKNYDFEDGYAIINLVKDSRISGNPQFTFEATGGSTNPAQNILEIFEGNSDVFGNGLNLGNEIDRNSFNNSIAFDDTKGFQSNIGLLDPSYGETIQSLLGAGSLILFEVGGRYKLIPETNSQVAAELHVTDDYKKDGIISGSWSLSTIDESRKFNVLRVTYPDAEEDYIQNDVIIDVTGEVDTVNGESPRIFENGELIDITDSKLDFLRTSTRNFPAVTSRLQATILGNQIFKKQNLGNIAFTCSVSLRHYFLEKGDIISVFIDELGWRGKELRILKVKENNDLGFTLSCSEHFGQMYL